VFGLVSVEYGAFMTLSSEVEDDGFADLVAEARKTVLPQLRRQFPAVADDAFGDALVKVFEQWPQFTAVERPLGWVWTVANRMAMRQAQRESRRPMMEMLASSSPTQDHAGWAQEILDGLSQLRPEHATALRLTQIDDLDVESAAAVLGVSANTTKVWVHRARRQLAARTAGIEGRWVSEEVVSPTTLARRLRENGHRHLTDEVLPIVGVDREVRWELHLSGGRYWMGTDDGARQDFGEVGLTHDVLSTRSIASHELVDGQRVPIPLGSNVGTSWQRFDIDGDRLHLRLVASEIPDTGGIPDPVFRQLLLDSITYRWVGHLDPLRPGGHPGTSRPPATVTHSAGTSHTRRTAPGS
jgi:RNA polymerase sigma factor (sigma-70 family)